MQRVRLRPRPCAGGAFVAPTGSDCGLEARAGKWAPIQAAAADRAGRPQSERVGQITLFLSRRAYLSSGAWVAPSRLLTSIQGTSRVRPGQARLGGGLSGRSGRAELALLDGRDAQYFN
jgi:hypothetical protein